MSVKKIVLTGGPCAGKTNILDYLKEKLRKEGYKVITVPETATELINSGFIPAGDYLQTMNFQNLVLKYQFSKEKFVDEYVKREYKNDDVIIIYDRGLLDNKAYLPKQEDFDKLLNNNNLEEIKITDKYNLVIDLLSTANVNSDTYKLDGIRYEDKESAKIVDKKTTLAWIMHNNLELVSPKDNFEDKKKEVLDIVHKFIKGTKKIDNEIYEIDYKSSDLNEYDETNSKTFVSEDIYLDIKEKDKILVISKRIFNSKESYLFSSFYKKGDELYLFDNYELTEEEYLKKLALYKINNIKCNIVTKFIDNDGLIKTIKMINDNYYIELPKNSKVPENIKIKENPECNKTLLKK